MKRERFEAFVALEVPLVGMPFALFWIADLLAPVRWVNLTLPRGAIYLLTGVYFAPARALVPGFFRPPSGIVAPTGLLGWCYVLALHTAIVFVMAMAVTFVGQRNDFAERRTRQISSA